MAKATKTKPRAAAAKPALVTPKRHGALYNAMPWNLRREINALGYGFSSFRIALVYLAIIGVMVGVGLAFKLPLIWTIPLIIGGLWFSPTFVRNSYRNRFERRRFSDVNVYIEQMLYAFKNSQKTLTTLEDVRVLFPHGSPMEEAIGRAIDIILDPTSSEPGESAEQAALRSIENRYPNDYVRSLHRFMLKVEAIGGNFDRSIDLLLKNRQMWETRVYKLQDQRRQKRSQILGSIAASLGLCIMMLYILPAEVDISAMAPVRITNVLLVLICMRIYLMADTKLSSDLLRSRTDASDQKTRDIYVRYLSFDAKRGMKMSLIFTLIPVLLIVVGWFVFQNIWVVTAGVLLFPIMMFQHRIGHALLGRRLRAEISFAFPQWLMELALLLQTDNVQVAIFKTIDEALPIMRPELERLRDQLIEHPASSEPFMTFFEVVNIPEVTTSMQMLYSLSVGSGGKADEQIGNIVERNFIILDRAEATRNEAGLSSLYSLFLLPVLLGGVALMVDMTAFLMVFMANLGGVAS